MLVETERFRYELMRLDQIRAIISRCPVAIQPTGLMEWHGEHNAIGLDGLNATYICERAILKLGDGVLMPTNWIGTYGFIRYPGTLCFNPHTTVEVFTQIYRELIKIGFKVIAILTGHYGKYQMNALFTAQKRIQREIKRRRLSVQVLAWNPPMLVPHIFGGDHAGKYETSALLRIGQAWNKSLVDLSRYRQGKEIIQQYRLWNEFIRIKESKTWNWPENFHDPHVCNPEFGEFQIKPMSEQIVNEICSALHKVGVQYSIPPS